MKIIKVKNINEMGKVTAGIIMEEINKDDSTILGLATGGTPVSTYCNLIKAYKSGNISFKNVKTFNLDEYVGLDGNHPNSYNRFMKEKLFNHIDIKEENTHLPCGVGDLYNACEDYKVLLERNTIHLQILGLGVNGHIGFNEPGVDFNLSVHVEKLDEQTRKDNSRYFKTMKEVPTEAITMGIKDIMRAEKIILLVNGIHKKDAFNKLLNGIETNECPVTILRRHKNLTVIITEDLYIN
ncbi:glucosamine-6-phosphate deaminase [Oceanirhabdus sp. W0125-5]|uniref:glucosamine-6-phosphate deaminase n=1 Tax=Oceanirhabdus sp. W0125-5 TaxID=2999116 RepID=UPI0022F2AAEA|nr:glucosamine-6-phosphate deaminase [Oceanirhabdus sp. W0125-5]WBW98897.1 glucosamine-6-phosphate deaminase [Oceanirhabdus sp. W0125-5]